MRAVPWPSEEQRGVAGSGVFDGIANTDAGAARIDPVPGRPDRLPAELDDVVPADARHDPGANPVRAHPMVCDHTANAFGRDSVTGFARRPLDHVGIQFGLAALNAGQMSKGQLLDLSSTSTRSSAATTSTPASSPSGRRRTRRRPAWPAAAGTPWRRRAGRWRGGGEGGLGLRCGSTAYQGLGPAGRTRAGAKGTYSLPSLRLGTRRGGSTAGGCRLPAQPSMESVNSRWL